MKTDLIGKLVTYRSELFRVRTLASVIVSDFTAFEGVLESMDGHLAPFSFEDEYSAGLGIFVFHEPLLVWKIWLISEEFPDKFADFLNREVLARFVKFGDPLASEKVVYAAFDHPSDRCYTILSRHPAFKRSAQIWSSSTTVE